MSDEAAYEKSQYLARLVALGHFGDIGPRGVAATSSERVFLHDATDDADNAERAS